MLPSHDATSEDCDCLEDCRLCGLVLRLGPRWLRMPGIGVIQSARGPGTITWLTKSQAEERR